MYGKDEKNTITEEKQKRKRIFIIVLTIGVLLFTGLLVRSIVLGGNGNKIQKQLDLGTKYLDDMDYEQALVAFEAALDIDPMNADAYLGIVEVHIRTNEFEKALEVAKEGYETTGDERLKEKIDMIESGDIFAANGWIMRTTGYDADGNLMYAHIYTNDIKGRKASVTRTDENGVKTQYLELDYDEDGRQLISYGFKGYSGELYKEVYEYGSNHYRVTKYDDVKSESIVSYREVDTDDDGHELREISYDPEGKVSGSAQYEYDQNGNVVKRTYYDENGEVTSSYIHTYDANGRRLQQQRYGADGEYRGYSEDVYDEEGNYLGQRAYDEEGNLKSERVTQ